MSKNHYVKCPFCTGVMEVRAEDGSIVQKWAPNEKEESVDATDRMSAALKKLDQAKEKRKTLFDQKKGELEEQKKKIEDNFRREVDRAKKEGPDKNPIRPFDLD